MGMKDRDFDNHANNAILSLKGFKLLMKTGISVLIVILLLISPVSLNGQGKKEGAPYLFGATYMTMNNPFFAVLDNGIREVVEARGDKMITLDPALDQKKQLDQVHTLIEHDVDLIFLNPVDWEMVKPALEAARAAGVPVINVDSPVFDEALVDAIVTSDNYNAGVLIAHDVHERVGQEVKIILFEHPETKSGIDRTRSFVDIAAGYPGFDIVARYNVFGQLEYAMPVMEEVIAMDIDFDVVMCTNDPSAIGALAALQAAGRDEGTYIYGVDGSPDAKKMVNEGKMTATVAQSPMSIGRTAAEGAYDLLAGIPIEHEILVPVELIDAENVVSFGLTGWQ